MLTEGRGRGLPRGLAFAVLLSGVVYLAAVGAYVTVSALVGWLT